METKEQMATRHASERDLRDVEEELRGILPGSPEPRIHFSPLFGRPGTIAYQHDFFTYPPEARIQPTLDFLAVLGRGFPAVGLTEVNDGCLSFVPTSWARRKAAKPGDSHVEIAPFLVHVELGRYPAAEVVWTSEIRRGLWELRVGFALADLEPGIGRGVLEYRDFKGGREVSRCDFNPGDQVRTIFGGPEEEPLADLRPRIKWASGSRDYPNKFTLSWLPTRADRAATLVDLAEALGAVRA